MRWIVAVALITIFVAVLVLEADEARILADKGRILFYKIERKVRLELNLPLRGTPDLGNLKKRLAKKGVKLGDPIFMRIFKKESELELWVQKGSQFIKFETYPICRWSGVLGPKLKEGDRQAPEGFYTIAKSQLNPNSRWHRSFNLGYPNDFDKSHGRTGSFLMVHGGCASIGCYAMTNPVIDELWAFVTAALGSGQERFHVHVFPFRMTQWNLAVHRDDKWSAFWLSLKKGHDYFEQNRFPPAISVCGNEYLVESGNAGSNGEKAIDKRCSAQTVQQG